MEAICVPELLLFFFIVGLLCFLLGVGAVTASSSSSEQSKKDQIVAQIRARGSRDREAVGKLRETYTEKMAQTAEELKGKRKSQ